MTRRTAALLILVAWIGVLGWLIGRERFRPRSTLLSEAALNISPGATYYRVLLGGEQIGFASNLVDTLPDAIRVENAMLLQIPALGELQRVDARTVAELSRTLRLRRFDATLRGDAARFGVRGTVDGDSVLRIEIESADSRRDMTVPLRGPIVLEGLLPLQLAFGGELAVGQTYNIRMFDPLLLEQRDVAVTITAESTMVVPDSAALPAGGAVWVAARWDTVHAWRVSQRVSGIEIQAWIDESGQVVHATSPVGFTMERTAFEIAFENFRRRDPSAASLASSDIIRQTAIASNATLPDRAAQSLRVRLGGVELEGFDLSGGRQTLEGNVLTITREPSARLDAAYRLPADTLAELRAPEPLIQSDDPRIVAQARQIVGRERDPRRAARLLTTWVYDALSKQITLSVPSAVDVLEARRGDCNEHTVLYVALARAAGIPARTAAGLVYVDGSFYYHAWPEVFLGDWVAVDPTFDQFPADAAHLRFTIGGLARQVELIRLIGRLELEVVEAG
jgi:hypothetical protein